MKFSDGLTRLWPSVGAMGLFCAGAALQARGMRHAGMGSAYVFVLGLEAVLAVGFGVVFFAEPVSGMKMVAVGLVVAGIALLRL